MINCPHCGRKAQPGDMYCSKCGEMLRPVVTIRTDAETAKLWRQQKWGEKGKAFRVALHLLKKELDGGRSLEDLDREYR